MTFFRSDLTDKRDINHHGQARSVDTKEDLNGYEISLVQKSPVLAFLDDKPSSRKPVEDKHAKMQKNKKLILRRCVYFSRHVKPFIALAFIGFYWVAGVYNMQRIE